MFLSSRHELYVLFATFTGGAVLGVIFDLFRIFRKNFKIASCWVWFQDILMWLAALVVVYVTIFVTNSAKVRWYELTGFAAGLTVYMLALSNFIIKIATGVISVVKAVSLFAFGIVSYPFKILFRLFSPLLKNASRKAKIWGKSLKESNKRIFLRLRSFMKKI